MKRFDMNIPWCHYDVYDIAYGWFVLIGNYDEQNNRAVIAKDDYKEYKYLIVRDDASDKKLRRARNRFIEKGFLEEDKDNYYLVFSDEPQFEEIEDEILLQLVQSQEKGAVKAFLLKDDDKWVEKLGYSSSKDQTVVKFRHLMGKVQNEMFLSVGEEKKKKLICNRHCGVYSIVDNGEVIYIGSSIRPFEERWKEHRKSGKWPNGVEYCSLMDFYGLLVSKEDVIQFEEMMIRRFQPRENVRCKGDELK